MLKVGELARRTGLTVRTLHHYDEIGLLTPSARSPAGYRLYGKADVERLYQVLALAGLGVPLAEIGVALAGAGPGIGVIVERQIAALDVQIEQGVRLRERLLDLHAHLARDDEPALDECLRTLELMALYDKYFSAQELDALRERKRSYLATAREPEAEWSALIESVRQQMAAGAVPAAPEVQALAARWQQLVRAFTGGDRTIEGKLSTMYKQESSLAGFTGLDPELMDFVRRAIAVSP